MALAHMIQHLTKYADLHFTGSRNRKIANGVYEVDIGIGDLVRLRSKIAETYYGILTLHQEQDRWLLPLYRHPRIPADSRSESRAARARWDKRSIQCCGHYAAMRDYDGFTAPSDYVRDFYSEYVWIRVSSIPCRTVSMPRCLSRWRKW